MRDDVTRWARRLRNDVWLIVVFSRKLYLILEDVELEYTEQRPGKTDSTMLNITNDLKTGSNQCWDYLELDILAGK